MRFMKKERTFLASSRLELARYKGEDFRPYRANKGAGRAWHGAPGPATFGRRLLTRPS